MKALLVLLFCIQMGTPGPGPKAFHIHVTSAERSNNGFRILAQSDKTIYHRHCDSNGGSCHMPTAGFDYLADNSKPAGNLVIYGIDEDSAVYIIDAEQEVSK